MKKSFALLISFFLKREQLREGHVRTFLFSFARLLLSDEQRFMKEHTYICQISVSIHRNLYLFKYLHIYTYIYICIYMRMVSCLVMCLTLQPHGLQTARLLRLLDYPNKNIGVGCHFLLLQNQGFFPKSRIFSSGGQSIRVSPSASVLPMNIQDGFPLGLTGLISSKSKGISTIFSSTAIQEHQFFSPQASLQSCSHIHT